MKKIDPSTPSERAGAANRQPRWGRRPWRSRSYALCAAFHAGVVLSLLPGRSFQVTSPPGRGREHDCPARSRGRGGQRAGGVGSGRVRVEGERPGLQRPPVAPRLAAASCEFLPSRGSRPCWVGCSLRELSSLVPFSSPWTMPVMGLRDRLGPERVGHCQLRLNK